jgi:hypothetical protein
MSMLLSVPDDFEMRELQRLLRDGNRKGVEQWVFRITRGSVVSIPDDIYEGWQYLANWGIDDLRQDVMNTLSRLS